MKKPSDDEHVKKPSDDDRSSECDKVTIKMISHAQATLEGAESEIRRTKKEEKELQPKTMIAGIIVHRSAAKKNVLEVS